MANTILKTTQMAVYLCLAVVLTTTFYAFHEVYSDISLVETEANQH